MRLYGLGLLIALAGCQGISARTVGTGSAPTFSPPVAKFYDEYLAIPGTNKSFAVSMDGRSAGASHCAEGGRYGKAASSLDEGRCGNMDFGALDACKAKAGKSPCYVYAWGNQVVWGSGNHPTATQVAAVTPPPPIPSRAAPPVEPTNARSPAIQTRKFVAIWEGVPGPINGEVTVVDATSAAQLTIVGANNLSCSGVAAFASGGGEWALQCVDGVTLTGRFRGLGRDQGALGEGLDSRGRKVTFALAPL